MKYQTNTLQYPNISIIIFELLTQLLIKNSCKMMDNVQQLNKSRYAQMQASIANKSSSFQSSGMNSSRLNLAGKFVILEEQMVSVDNQTKNLLQSTKESSRQLNQMKKVLGQKQLNQTKLKCLDEVKKVEKFVTYGITEANKRTENLWAKCKGLANSSEQLKNLVTLLNNKLNNLEITLGYYNGAEIVSNY